MYKYGDKFYSEELQQTGIVIGGVKNDPDTMIVWYPGWNPENSYTSIKGVDGLYTHNGEPNDVWLEEQPTDSRCLYERSN